MGERERIINLVGEARELMRQAAREMIDLWLLAMKTPEPKASDVVQLAWAAREIADNTASAIRSLREKWEKTLQGEK